MEARTGQRDGNGVWPVTGNGLKQADGIGVVAATPESISRAARRLRDGEIVAFPTETVYGLGADATNDDAVAAVYAAKGRPASNPLIVHVAKPDAARDLARFDGRAEALAATFWPGPLTLILSKQAGCAIAGRACAGRDTVALRVPGGDVALALIRSAGRPIAGPSANLSGRPSPTTARHVHEGLGDAVSMILDGGPCTVGIESTIMDLTGGEPLLLRPGGVPVEAIEELIGPVGRPHGAGQAVPTSPGGRRAITRRTCLSGWEPSMRIRMKRCLRSVRRSRRRGEDAQPQRRGRRQSKRRRTCSACCWSSMRPISSASP